MTQRPGELTSSTKNTLLILIVSGGVGASAEQVVHTVLAQFPAGNVHVTTKPNIRHLEQLELLVNQARQNRCLIVHTLVDANLRHAIIRLAAENQIPAVDLMGDLLSQIENLMGQAPLEQPGLYRRLNKTYYDRVAAIDFAMRHDDGKDPSGWENADLLLLGVSRCGKTPLSLYLSVLGWKIANLPLVPGLALPQELELVDRKHIVGLKIDAGQLLLHRQERQRSLGAPGLSDYTNPLKVEHELEFAQEVYRTLGCKVIDVTDKPIESSADELIRKLAL